MPKIDSGAVARRIELAVAEGRMIAVRGSCQVEIDLGDGDRVVVFNDAGCADYSESITLAGVTYEYGTDFAMTGNQDDLPGDPLDLVSREAAAAIEILCAETF